ncbi:MAG: hypothetical protein U5K00_08660 [Melioribacteraceae bacterium]|nr:hypothetical protein [Melioribacteraceae bacterium]
MTEPVEFECKSIRGEPVLIYGEGVYKHMSADVAIQGIAQDYVTSFYRSSTSYLAALIWFKKNSIKGLLFLSGTLGYFLSYISILY